MAGPLGLGNLFPPLSTTWTAPTKGANVLGDPEDESVVVSTTDILNGNIEHTIGQAERIASYQAPSESPTSSRDIVNSISDGMDNPNIPKNGGFWNTVAEWSKPLAYFDIPSELLVGGAIDLAELAIPGKQDWGWARGDQTERFQAWKGLFKDDPAKTGWGEFKSRLDNAAIAFEQRPWYMELALTGIQIAATWGAGAYVKGAQVAGMGAGRYAAIRAAQYTIDPMELAFVGIGKTVRGGYRGFNSVVTGGESATTTTARGFKSNLNAYPNLFEDTAWGKTVGPKAHAREVVKHDAKGKVLWAHPIDEVQEVIVETEGGTKIRYEPLDLEAPITLDNVKTPLADAKSLEYQELFQSTVKAEDIISPTSRDVVQQTIVRSSGREAGNFIFNNMGSGKTKKYGMAHVIPVDGMPVLDTTALRAEGRVQKAVPVSPNSVWAKNNIEPPVISRANELQRLYGDLWSVISNPDTDASTMRNMLQHLSLLSLSHGMAARPGEIARLTYKQLRDYVDGTGQGQHFIYIKEVDGDRSGVISNLDNGEGLASAKAYLEEVDRWAATNNLTKKQLDNVNVYGIKFDSKLEGRAVLKDVAKGDTLKSRPKKFLKLYRGEHGRKRGAPKELQELLKVTGPQREAQIYNLPREARKLRNQRISERFLAEGADIQALKNDLRHHNSDNLIRGYIEEVDNYTQYFPTQDAITNTNIHHSPIFDQMRLTGSALDEVNADPNRMRRLQEASENREQLTQNIRRQRGEEKAAGLERRKGLEVGSVEDAKVIVQVGDTYMESEILYTFMDANEKLAIDTLALKSHVADEVIDIAMTAAKLKALRYAAMIQKAAFDLYDHKRMSIRSRATSTTEQGKLKRAGYDFRVREGDLRGQIDQLKLTDRAKRDKYAISTGLDNVFGIGKNANEKLWDDWAQGLMAEHKEVVDAIDQYALVRYNDINTGERIVTNMPLHHALYEYGDMLAKDVYARYESLSPVNRESINMMRMTMEELRFYGSGMNAQLIKKGGRMNYMRQRATMGPQKDLINQIDINEGRRLQKGKGNAWFGSPGQRDGFSGLQKRNRVRDWLMQPGTRTVLHVFYKINKNTYKKSDGAERIKGAVRKAAMKYPQIFGHNFNPDNSTELTEWVVDSKGVKKMVFTKKGEDFIGEIGDIVYNASEKHPEYLSTYKDSREMVDEFEVLDLADVVGGGPPLRPDVFSEGMDDALSGNNPIAGGTHPTAFNTFGSVRSSLNSHGARIVNGEVVPSHTAEVAKSLRASDTWYGNALLKFLKFGNNVFAGGQGVYANPNAKIVSALHSLYEDVEAIEGIKLNALHDVTSGLGIRTTEATPAMKKQGIRNGTQYFGGLKIKGTDENPHWIKSQENGVITYDERYMHEIFAELVGHEQKTNVRAAYLRNEFTTPTATKLRSQGGQATHIDEEFIAETGETVYKIRGQDMYFDDREMANIANLLRHPDVVLERIPASQWEDYFDLDDSHRHNLVWLQMWTQEVDKMADAAGVNVVQMVLDKGGKYLKQYSPRLYQLVNRISLGSKPTPIKILNSYEGHFMKRTKPDILDVLARANKADLMETGFANTMLLPIEDRMVLYHSMMLKQVLNKEAETLLKELPSWSAGRESARGAVRALKWLDNLKRMVNEKSTGDPSKVLPAERIQLLNDNHGLGIPGLDIHDWAWLTNEEPWSFIKARDLSGDMRVKIMDMELEVTGKLDQAGISERHRENTWLNNVWGALKDSDRRAMRQMMTAHSDDIFGKTLLAGANTLDPFTQMVRTFKTGLDMGTPFIHGWASLVKMPWVIDGKFSAEGQVNFTRAYKEMIQLFMHPNTQTTFMKENRQEFINANRWTQLNEGEALGALANPEEEAIYGWFYRMMNEHLPAAQKVPVTPENFKAAFMGFTNSLRVMMFTSLEPNIVKALKASGKDRAAMGDAAFFGDKLVHKKYTELGQAVNKMTGVFDQDMAMTTPFQRKIERNFLFFAPMYRRATWGIVGDLASGGIKRREALRQLSGLVGVGIGMAILAEASGNNPRAASGLPEYIKAKMTGDDTYEGELDLTARFAKFNFQGYQFGIAGAWWTVFRLASDLAMDMTEDEDDSASEEWNEHPILVAFQRRGRSQMAPVAGMIADITQGKTFIGEPLRDTDGSLDWDNVIKHGLSSLVPFYLDSAFTGAGHSAAGRGAAGAAEFFGIAAYPISEYDNLQVSREDAVHNWEHPDVSNWRVGQVEAELPISWETAPKVIRNLIEDDNPAVRAQLADYHEQYGRLQDATAADFSRLMRDKSEHTLELIQGLVSTSVNFEAGKIDGRGFNQAIQQVFFAKRAHNTVMMAKDEYKAMEQKFASMKLSGLPWEEMQDKIFYGDFMFDKWMSDVVYGDVFDSFGQFSWDKRDYLESQFWNANGGIDEGLLGYFKELQTYWIRDIPMLNEFEAVKDRLRPYWDAHNVIYEPGTAMNSYARQYYAMPQSHRNAAVRANPIFKQIDKQVAGLRKSIRQRDADIDKDLAIWYGHRPIHASSQRAVAEFNSNALVKKRAWEENRVWLFETPRQDSEFQSFAVSPSGRINRKPELTGV